MGKFYLHKNNVLYSVGYCPDGMEKSQGHGDLEVGLGEPPEHIQPQKAEKPYTIKRLEEYPSVGHQLDVLWKVLEPVAKEHPEGKKMLDLIQGIKRKYPKEAKA